ncbi:hypothetical protein F5B19DRAFT_127849 [Rostrohypoxylon terebratum]|nr:hypothetical protein F5B19DRAFT_127849 [Rostrohypoxylon terebratum]
MDNKLYWILPSRLVFMEALLLFEIGSLIFGVAPTNPALISSGAMAGIGAAGIGYLLGNQQCPQHHNPLHAYP